MPVPAVECTQMDVRLESTVEAYSYSFSSYISFLDNNSCIM